MGELANRRVKDRGTKSKRGLGLTVSKKLELPCDVQWHPAL